MKKIFCMTLALILCLSALTMTGCSKEKEPGADADPILVCIQVKDYGDITVELYPDVAPITVKNFTDLVEQGFYDGVIFHRIISGFMIQGGDPTGSGYGGPGYSIKGEFSANGVQNDLKHERGVISMARGSTNPDSAGSQFFIVHQTAPHLDGQYAAFGKVVDGMDVVDAIAAVQTNSNDKPLTDVVMEHVFIVEGE